MSDIESEMKAMMAGAYTSDVMPEEEKAQLEKNEGSDEIGDEIAEPSETTGVEVTKDEGGEALEDTDASPEVKEEADTKDAEVVPNPDTEDTGAEDKQEDAQVGEVDTKTADKKEDEPEKSDEAVDYKQQYDKLLVDYEKVKAFQDKVTGDFKAGKKMVNGITDPDQIVKNLQMSVGLTKKLDGYKSVKPVIKPLEDRGLLQDTAKFDMLMKLSDGDQEALKYYLNEHKIDPLGLDVDEVKYDNTSTVASNAELQYEEMYDRASMIGVGDQFASTVLREWDADSAGKLFEEGGEHIGAKLAEQMSNGVYDKVMGHVENMKLTNPTFSAMSSFDQYEAASKVFNNQAAAEYQRAEDARQQELVVQQKTKEAEEQRLATIEAEKARLIKDKQEADYAAKVAAEEAKVAEQRDKAAQASTTRTVVTPPANEEKQNLSTDDFRAQWKQLMAK